MGIVSSTHIGIVVVFFSKDAEFQIPLLLLLSQWCYCLLDVWTGILWSYESNEYLEKRM